MPLEARFHKVSVPRSERAHPAQSFRLRAAGRLMMRTPVSRLPARRRPRGLATVPPPPRRLLPTTPALHLAALSYLCRGTT